MFKEIRSGMYKEVSLPVFGKQDVGVTPGGAMDRFSLETGNAILGNEPGAPALQIIFGPAFELEKDCYFVLTGGMHKSVKVSGVKSFEVEHGRVCFAAAGSQIDFGEKEYGFRTYLCYIPADQNKAGDKLISRERGPFESIANWMDPQGKIRVVEGPEYSFLDDKDSFVNNYWKITPDTSDMGMRLENVRAEVSVTMDNMISEAVSDGTIQLTPKGPIILLKHRQTVGGYPRIFNVISADVDLLAQYMPGQVLHFKKVSIEEAHKAAKQKKNDLDEIKQKFN